MKLDEAALRRPEFTPGVPVVLADGQSWELPKPVVVLFPEIGADGNCGLGARPTLDDAFDELMETYEAAKTERAAEAQGANDEWARARVAVGAYLLQRNYAVSPKQVARLLVWQPGDETSEAMWALIIGTAYGHSPKALPAGAEPS